MAVTKKTTKKAAQKKQIAGKAASKAAATKTTPRSMPKTGRDPKGGLTAKGRAFFNEKEGSHLRPGVQGPADTPEKMVRKGSFLRRHFTHPRGPMIDEKGQPTRLALSAHAWGEPVPKTMAAAKRLAQKGHELLERYHTIQDQAQGRSAAKKAKTGSTAVKGSAKKKVPKKSPARDGRSATAAKGTAPRTSAPRKAASVKAGPRPTAGKGATKASGRTATEAKKTAGSGARRPSSR